MHCRHQAFDDAELVIENLGNRSQAVRGAGGIGDNFHVGLIRLVVHAHHKHGCIIFNRSCDDHALGAGIKMALGHIFAEEESRGFDDVICADFAPLQIGGNFFSGHADLLAIDHKLSAFNLHIALKSTMRGIVFEHVCEIIHIHKIIDSNNLNIFASNRGSENKTPDTAESIDTNFYNAHDHSPYGAWGDFTFARVFGKVIQTWSIRVYEG